jgi:tetratricopeptide (TPR) repeat protein
MAQECDHNQELDLDTELAIAERALNVESDPAHAGFHLASALFLAPLDPRVIALFHEWWSFSDSDQRDKAAEKPTWIGELLLRAYIRAQQARLPDAIRTVLQSLSHGATIDCLILAGQWWQRLVADAKATAIAPPELFAQLQLGSVMVSMLKSDKIDREPVLPAFDDFLDQIDAHANLIAESAASTNYANTVAWSAPEIILRVKTKRAANRLKQALALAESMESKLASFETAVALAACHRDLEDIDAAIDCNWLAAKRKPEDGFIFLDIGDLALDCDRFAEAISAYEHAIKCDANPAWAKLSKAAASHLASPSASTRASFEAIAREPDIDADRLDSLRWRTDSWITRVPFPQEAILNLLRQVNDYGHSLEVGLSALEAPTAIFHAQEVIASVGGQLLLSCALSEPDPRAGDFALAAFRFEIGDSAESIRITPKQFDVAPLKSAVMDEIAELAQTPFDAKEWLRAGRQIQAAHSPNAKAIVATMAYPPPVSQDGDALYFRKCYVAACVFVIGANPLAGMQDLRTLIAGPIDWPGEAAVLCWVARAVADEIAKSAINEQLEQISNRCPEQGDFALRRGVDAAFRWLAEQG